MNFSSLSQTIKQRPHWRVNIHPEVYVEDRIQSLSDCWALIDKNKVALRGWDYPHIGQRPTETDQGQNWIASGCSSDERYEYWRLYQSGQFIHLFLIDEVTSQWKEHVKEIAKFHLRQHKDIDWDAVPGLLSITNVLYQITEIIEFTSRLAESALYQGSLSISVSLVGIHGFLLTAARDRVWRERYGASENALEWKVAKSVDVLVAERSRTALEGTMSLFERFGWFDPPLETMKRDQENFLSGRT